MPPIEASDVWFMFAGLVAGLLLGLVVAGFFSFRLRHKLAAAESKLVQREEIEREREQVFSLAS